MQNCVVISPKCSSESAKYLADHLECEYVNPYKTGRLNFEDYKVVVNYGVSESIRANKVINSPTSIRRSVNKLHTFDLVKDSVPIMEYTISKEKAKEWVRAGYWVVIRETVEGSRSSGVLITGNIEDIENSNAPLYTMYVPHTNELRVNCYKGKVLTVLDKVADSEGNFDFQLLSKFKHPWLADLVKNVHEKIGLDIMGLDVLLTERNELCFLEVNSAPSLFGVTSTKIATALWKEVYV